MEDVGHAGALSGGIVQVAVQQVGIDGRVASNERVAVEVPAPALGLAQL